MDKVTAARAMLKLSRSYDQVMIEYGLKPPASKKKEKTADKSTGKNNVDSFVCIKRWKIALFPCWISFTVWTMFKCDHWCVRMWEGN